MNNPNLSKIIRQDPSLVWYTKNNSGLSDKSILEHVLNYGTWEQVQTATNELGFGKMKKLYESLTSNSRVNIRPRTKHFFDLYFSKTNAPKHTN